MICVDPIMPNPKRKCPAEKEKEVKISQIHDSAR